jgi:hypothetical protein
MDPWERQRGESARAYAAFITYRDMGPQRSHAKVAQNLGKTKVLIHNWGRLWRWTERCGEWDYHLQKEADAAHVAAVKEVGERHAKLAIGMQKRIARRLAAMSENAMELEIRDIARWVDVAVKIERLSMGMSTQAVEHAGKDGGAIQIEQIRERLKEKLLPIDEQGPDEGP